MVEGVGAMEKGQARVWISACLSGMVIGELRGLAMQHHIFLV